MHRVGAFGALGIAYRSSYFLQPYVSVGYATLADGETHLPNGDYGAGGTLHQHLGMWTISPGLIVPLWRFRPHVGVGIAVVEQSYEFLGQNHTVTQTPLLSDFGLGFVVHDGERFRFDVEGRAVIATGASVSFGTLDLILRGDLVYFGSH